MVQTPESEETTWHKSFPVQNTSIFFWQHGYQPADTQVRAKVYMHHIMYDVLKL